MVLVDDGAEPGGRLLWEGGHEQARKLAADARKAGVANGGKAIEDPPGVRQGGAGAMYLAYLRDPDGNKLCALHRMPAA